MPPDDATAHVQRERGGRHPTRTDDLLHVKQVQGRNRGRLSTTRTLQGPSVAGSWLDNGWTAEEYRVVERL